MQTKQKHILLNEIREIREALKHRNLTADKDFPSEIPIFIGKEKIKRRILSDKNEFDDFDKMNEDYTVIDLDSFDISLEGKISINKKVISEKLENYGVEAIAWYAPIHYYDENFWGIYYDLDGILYFIEQLYNQVPNVQLIKNTIKLLKKHELFHFQIEMFYILIELFGENNLISSSKTGRLTLSKFINKFNYSKRTNLDLEEALATAKMFNGFNGSKKKNLANILNILPDGYSQCKNYIDDTKFNLGLKDLFNYEINELRLPLNLLLPEEYFTLSKNHIPERLIVNNKYVRFGQPFPKKFNMKIMVYTNDHEPPHFHIFTPPEKEFGRFTFPDLKPLDNATLSKSQLKNLVKYWEKYGNEVKVKLLKVYPSKININEELKVKII